MALDGAGYRISEGIDNISQVIAGLIGAIADAGQCLRLINLLPFFL